MFDKIRNKIANIISTNENVTKDENMTINQLIDFLNLSGTNEKELSEATYFACMKILAESLGKLPLKLLSSNNKSGIIEKKEHPLYRILRYKPNSYTTATSFWSAIEYNKNHFGNAYVLIIGTGKNTKLHILPSDKIKPIWDNAKIFNDKEKLWYACNINGKYYTFSNEEILHFKTSTTFDGITGVSVKDQLKTTITGNAKAQNMINKMYDSGFTAKAILQYTGDLSDENVKTYVKSIKSYAEGTIKGNEGIVPIPIGSTLQPLNIKLADNEFVEIKKYTALQIANAFGIKPNQINDYSKASYASAEAQQLAFYVDTLLYILKQYEEELTYKLLTEDEIKKGLFFKFNISVLLRADLKTQMDSLSTAVSNSIYTSNEARAFLDLEAKPGGDKLIGNGSMIPVEMMGQQYIDKGGG